MANQQPTTRPWFRLASQIRLEQPPPPPTTPAAAPPARPMFGRLQSFLPLTPPPAAAPPPPPPAPKKEPLQGRPARPTIQQPPTVPVPEKLRSPTPPVTRGTSPAPAAFRNTVTPPESPKVIKPSAQTPPESPRSRMPKEPPLTSPSPRRFLAYSPPPTPPRLQQPNPEPEPAMEKQNLPPRPAQAPSSLPTFQPPYPKKIEDHYSKSLGEDKIAVTESANVKSNSSKKKKPSASESSASALGMLTIAGENTGAYMELGCGRRNSKNPEPFTGRFYQLSKKDDHLLQSDNGATVEEAKKKKNAPGNAVPMAVLVNSNVQGANNSLLFNSTCVHGSPGVHIFLSSPNNRRRSGTPPPKIDGYL